MVTNSLEILKSNRFLQNEAEMTHFISALNELKLYLDPPPLIELYKVFDDRAVNTPPLVMLHVFIKQYDCQTRIDALVKVTPAIVLTAIEWLKTFYLELMAMDECLKMLGSAITKSTYEQKTSIFAVLETLKHESLDDDQMEAEVRQEIEFLERFSLNDDLGT